MFGGAHRFEFVGKEPLLSRSLVMLLLANTLLFLGLDFGAPYFLPKASASLPACPALASGGVQVHAPAILCWYADRAITIQFVLLALIAVTMLIFRKRVRYVYRGRKHPG